MDLLWLTEFQFQIIRAHVYVNLNILGLVETVMKCQTVGGFPITAAHLMSLMLSPSLDIDLGAHGFVAMNSFPLGLGCL